MPGQGLVEEGEKSAAFAEPAIRVEGPVDAGMECAGFSGIACPFGAEACMLVSAGNAEAARGIIEEIHTDQPAHRLASGAA